MNVGRFKETDADETLVNAVLSRDELAFAELYRRHLNSVTTSSRMIVGNQPEADDVAAEVFLRFWLEPEKFDGARGSLLTYLRMQAKGRSIDVIRGESARGRRERNDAQSSRMREPDIDSGVLVAEAAEQLQAALYRLPKHERYVIELAYFDGLTYVAVAERLGLPEGTVKSQIRKGMARLRSIYENDLTAESQNREDGATLGTMQSRNLSKSAGTP